VIAELSERTGWRIQVAPRVDQQAVLVAAQSLIPETWGLRKNPGLDLPRRQVILKFSAPPAADELTERSQELEERTGFGFVVK